MKLCVAIVLCFFFVFGVVTLPNARAESDTEICVVSQAVPVSVEEFAQERVDSLTMIAYDHSDGFGVSFDGASGITMGSGFYKYELTDEGLTAVDCVYFPIIQDGQVKLILNVFADNGSWTSFFSKGFAEQLNVIGTNQVLQVIQYEENLYFVTASGVTFVDGFGEDDSQEAAEALSQIPMTASANVVALNEKVCDVHIEEKVQPCSGPNGFLYNEPNYKTLNTVSCLLNQLGPNGETDTKLCWAASAATMIRYRSGNRTITAAEAAASVGKTYNDAGSADLVWQVLDNYGVATTQYQVKDRDANSSDEIRHNINNMFPIYMSMEGYNIIDGFLRHGVTIVGYEASTAMNMICWNSGTQALEVVEFNGTSKGTCYPYGRTNYYWDRSVLVPLS